MKKLFSIELGLPILYKISSNIVYIYIMHISPTLNCTQPDRKGKQVFKAWMVYQPSRLLLGGAWV
jgi:hypothetical protein